MPNQEDALDDIFKALADPTRRAVVSKLTEGSASVKELAEPFDMALPSFMQHLQVLEESGIVRTQKIGRVRQCEIVPHELSAAEEWIARLRAIWEARLERLDAYLEELQQKEDDA
jgi:DNA-binding transcriptional ArsR family regulator